MAFEFFDPFLFGHFKSQILNIQIEMGGSKD